MDLSKAPPISQKRTLAFVNHFIINTVAFLNKFMLSCESKLQKFDQRMQKLEASLSILEAKLSSVPGLEVEAPSVPQVQPEIKATLVQHPEEQSTPQKEESIPVDTANNVETSKSEEAAPKEDNPSLAKYRKMLQVGVPVQGVKMTMRADGVDPDLLGQ